MEKKSSGKTGRNLLASVTPIPIINGFHTFYHDLVACHVLLPSSIAAHFIIELLD
jgi:hypothetical protein